MNTNVSWTKPGICHRLNGWIDQRSLLALELETLYRRKAKENLSTAGKIYSPKEGLQNSAKVTSTIDTRKELATIANVSHDTIAKVKVMDNMSPPPHHNT